MDFEKQFEEAVRKNWNSGLLGSLKNINVQLMKAHKIKYNGELDTFPIKLMLSSLAAALSTQRLLGTAKNESDTILKSVKSRMDTSASYAFYDYWKKNEDGLFISASEGKDERGSDVEDPLKLVAQEVVRDYGIAVDVVDGTTLAAKGINGAYSIAGAAGGLRSFTDMQAYAIGGPVEVLSRLDYSNNPELEVVRFINFLKDYYGKSVNELKIVTHSQDTGMHHNKLISVMREMGVQVIVPNPVIVEPPYVASMALKLSDSPDGMIGVFGLPEIVINALLCANISANQELWFRIASNEMLSYPENDDLSMTFSFSGEEKATLSAMGLSTLKVYKKEDLAENIKNACFTAVALTDDSILKFNGIRRKENAMMVETLFSGYEGVTLKMITEHEMYNDIVYTARNHQKIDDVSAVIPIVKPTCISYLNKLKKCVKTEGFDNLQFTSDKEMHITVHEYGIHYGGYNKNIQKEIEKILLHIKNAINFPLRLILSKPILLKDTIVCEVIIPDEIKNVLLNAKLPNESMTDFENVNKMPDFLHITIARLVEYMGYEEWQRLYQIISEFPKPSDDESEIEGELRLIRIKQTPFDEVEIIS